MAFKDFMNGYLQCALWTGLTDDGTPLDSLYSVDDIHPESLAEHEKGCRDFYDSHYVTWFGVGMSDDDAGHNFSLTRNGHGTGFWDRGLGKVGRDLTEACRAYGEAYLYVGDDGVLYFL